VLNRAVHTYTLPENTPTLPPVADLPLIECQAVSVTPDSVPANVGLSGLATDSSFDFKSSGHSVSKVMSQNKTLTTRQNLGS
jgi:hypothetical protein